MPLLLCMVVVSLSLMWRFGADLGSMRLTVQVCNTIQFYQILLVNDSLFHKGIFLATFLAILLRHKLHESLPGVTCPVMNTSRNFCVAATVAKRISRFYVVQWWLQQKHCDTSSFEGMLHYATFRATCVTTAQRNCETSFKTNCLINKCDSPFMEHTAPWLAM